MMSYNLCVIPFLMIAMLNGSFSNGDVIYIKCALTNDLCNLAFSQPCCNLKESCKQITNTRAFRCVSDDYEWGLGKFCELDEDCDEISHAKCSKDNKCICRENNVKMNPWTCAPILGKFCWKDELCAAENAACIDGECKCTAHYFSRPNNQCQRKILGTSCETDEVCSSQVRFSKCSTDGTCTCAFNTTEVNPAYCAPIVGGFCWQTDECVTEHSKCVGNKCQCIKNTEYDFTERRCRPGKGNLISTIVILKTICSSSTHCMCYREGAESFLVCRPTQVHGCVTNVSCVVKNSMCIEGFCQCSPRFLYKSERCIPRYLNEACEYNSDCNEIGNTVCSNGNICVCDEKHIEYNATSCKPVLDGFCSNDEDCMAVNSSCVENKCKCKLGTVRYTKDMCIIPQLGIPCEEQFDCAEILGSQCSNHGKCECIPTYEDYNITACAPLLGRTCSEQGLCAVTHSSCVDEKCLCDYGYLEHSIDKCIPHHIGMECNKDSDCRLLLDTKCIDSICSCHSTYVPLNSSVCAPLLDGSCRLGQECSAVNSLCIDKKCQCQLGYKHGEGNRCIRNAYNSDVLCDYDDQCNNIKYSYCSVDKKCVCNENYVLSKSKKCLGLIGETCYSDEECISDNTVCINNKCQCSENFQALSKYYCSKISLGFFCQNDHHCSKSIKNSVCAPNNVCVCRKNYFALNKFKCLPKLLENCLINDDCRANASACFKNKCQCLPGFRAVSEFQCEPLDYMYTCNTILDCGDPWHYQCGQDKKCRCSPHHYSINRSTCSPILGGYCWKDSQCLVNESACIDFHCECRENFVAVSDNLCRPGTNSTVGSIF